MKVEELSSTFGWRVTIRVYNAWASHVSLAVFRQIMLYEEIAYSGLRW